MEFSAMLLNMYFPSREDTAEDEYVIAAAVEQAIWMANLGFHPWTTDHHFRGPWHSNPLQFAAHIAPLIPANRYIGFGVLSVPFYHPLRLVESMNLLDHLTKGKVLCGLGSGWQGTEPEGLGVDRDYHASGRMADDALAVMQRLWTFKNGDPEYSFEVGANRGLIKRRVTPGPYTKPHPILIRTASREASIIKAAQNGWPAFLGALGADLRAQSRMYQKALAEAGHQKHVVEQCLRWSTNDWLSVAVAPTDKEATEWQHEAQAEQIATRLEFIDRHGKIDGPVIKLKPGQTIADAYASGGDMIQAIAGSPDTVAAKVQEVMDLGINHLLLRFVGEWTGKTRPICEASARLFAQEVMPRFKTSAAPPAHA